MMMRSLQATALVCCTNDICLTKQRIAWLERGYQHRHRRRPLHLVPLEVIISIEWRTLAGIR
jgi:hypothetical protein